MANVLVVSAHPDDEVLGCGGMIYRLAAAGSTLTACVLVGDAGARAGRPDVQELHGDVRKAQTILGARPPILGTFPNIELNTVAHLALVQFIESAIAETGAEILVTHHPGDLNDDHVQTSRACQAAARVFQRRPGSGRLRGLLFMEIQSSSDWTFAEGSERFVPDAFFEIGEEGMEAKLKALGAYRGVMRPYPHPRSEEAVRALAVYRGGQSGMQLAEAFQVAFLDVGSIF